MTSLAWIDADAVRQYLPMAELIERLREALASDAMAPERQIYRTSETASLLVMPAWNCAGELGTKLVQVDTARARAVEALYILHHAKAPGAFTALDGAMLTARRTAALSALGADILAMPKASRLLLVGTGTLIPHLLEGYSAIRSLSHVAIWGRNFAKAEALASKLSSGDLRPVAVNDLDAAIGDADMVCCATSSSAPLVKGSCLNPGTHLNLLGAFRPDMSEADPQAFTRAEIYVDSYDGVLAEAGDFLDAIAAGAVNRDDITAQLSEMCQPDFRLPSYDEERITLFKSVGLSLADLAAAQLVMEGFKRNVPQAQQ